MNSSAETRAIYPFTWSSYLFVAMLLALLGGTLQVLNFDEDYILADVISCVVLVYILERARPTTAVRIAVVAAVSMGAMLIHLGLSSPSPIASRILFVAAGTTLFLEVFAILTFAWMRTHGSTRA